MTENMTDQETAAHIRKWLKGDKPIWGWPTDGCGYDQHIKFVNHRNKNWTDEMAKAMTFDEFTLRYAEALETNHPIEETENG